MERFKDLQHNLLTKPASLPSPSDKRLLFCNQLPMAGWPPTRHENYQVLSSPLMPACGRRGGGLRRELSRTIEMGVDMACSPSPPPSPLRARGSSGPEATRGEGEYWDYFQSKHYFNPKDEIIRRSRKGFILFFRFLSSPNPSNSHKHGVPCWKR